MNFVKLFQSLPHGWLSKVEARALFVAANKCKGTVLEVGCYLGRSTVLLAATGKQVISVDPFKFPSNMKQFCWKTGEEDEICRKFENEIKKRGIVNVQFYRCRIEDWKRVTVRFAYLDGLHTYQGTLNQIDIALDCGAVGICVHDYCNGENADVVRAVTDRKDRIQVLTVIDRLAICRVVGDLQCDAEENDAQQ